MYVRLVTYTETFVSTMLTLDECQEVADALELAPDAFKHGAAGKLLEQLADALNRASNLPKREHAVQIDRHKNTNTR